MSYHIISIFIQIQDKSPSAIFASYDFGSRATRSSSKWSRSSLSSRCERCGAVRVCLALEQLRFSEIGRETVGLLRLSYPPVWVSREFDRNMRIYAHTSYIHMYIHIRHYSIIIHIHKYLHIYIYTHTYNHIYTYLIIYI